MTVTEEQPSADTLSGYYAVWGDLYYQITPEGDRWALRYSDGADELAPFLELGRRFDSRPTASAYAYSHARKLANGFGDDDQLLWVYSPSTSSPLRRKTGPAGWALVVVAVVFAFGLIGAGVWALLWVAP